MSASRSGVDGRNIQVYSVRDIVKKRVQPGKDDWHLALVQRNLVWDEERICRLLDSLLRGYPIGSLLFCELDEESEGRGLSAR